jgi:hypothetical protein
MNGEVGRLARIRPLQVRNQHKSLDGQSGRPAFVLSHMGREPHTNRGSVMALLHANHAFSWQPRCHLQIGCTSPAGNAEVQ